MRRALYHCATIAAPWKNTKCSLKIIKILNQTQRVIIFLVVSRSWRHFPANSSSRRSRWRSLWHHPGHPPKFREDATESQPQELFRPDRPRPRAGRRDGGGGGWAPETWVAFTNEFFSPGCWDESCSFLKMYLSRLLFGLISPPFLGTLLYYNW